ncbi:hypothetical protein F9L07_19750 [Pimelobacter simplex]|uniref:DUF2335 domain-containing protein n=1 Tax=Nocardioides simplex TaxID=2045 RepID=A0A7J5DVC1_NOCSI|nr:hypothetical protein [Pimelobacter simplex]KAB2809278.1 hypothetical protein F9L07_19750 [Pimelobacter simplex]
MKDDDTSLDSVGGDDDVALQSGHEQHGSSSPAEPFDEEDLGEDRVRSYDGSDRIADVPSMARDRSRQPRSIDDGRREPRFEDDVTDGELVEAERIAPLVLAQIQQHLHLPIQVPDGEALASLKRNDPAAHRMWLKQVKKEMGHHRWMQSAEYRMPLRVMISAHVMALIALVVLAGLAGYALYLDHVWLAGIFGGLDVAAIVGLFILPGWGGGGDAEDDRR